MLAVIFCLWLMIHLAIYVLAARTTVLFRRELPIFLFHAVPAAIAVVSAAGIWLIDPSNSSFILVTFVISLQGIYSVSFLELWSLAQGGYSLSILGELARAESEVDIPDRSSLGLIGAGKQGDRLEGLKKLGLLSAGTQGRLQLTGCGTVVALAIAGIRRFANVRDMG